MKTTHFALLFFILFLAIMFSVDIDRKSLDQMDEAILRMDEAVEQATLAASETIPYAEETSSWDTTSDAFFTNMYISLGIMGDQSEQLRLQDYCPICAVISPEYLMVQHEEKITAADGSSEYARVWSNRIPYVYSDPRERSGFTYRFTGTNQCEIYDSDGILSPIGEKLSYKVDLSDPYDQVIQVVAARPYSSSILLLDQDLFEEVRLMTMVDTCEKYLACYMSEYNILAKEKGITYEFTFPSDALADIKNSIDHTAFMSFFQGYPLRLGTKIYNRYTSIGAKAVLQAEYVVDTDGYYHLPLNIRREDDGGYSHYTVPGEISVTYIFHDERSCAEVGAKPCPKCYPHLTW